VGLTLLPPVVLSPSPLFATLAYPSLSVGLFNRLGLVDGQWDGMNEGMGKMNHNFHRGSFSVMHWMGLPIHGSPLVYPSPHFLRRVKQAAHIPSKRGWVCVITSSLLR